MSTKNLFSLRLLGACLVGASLLVSCSKNSTPASGPTGTYQPDSVGATWTYAVSEDFSPSNSLLLSALEDSGYQFNAFDTSFTEALVSSGNDTTIGGLQYNTLTESGYPVIYFSQQDSLYYSVGLLPDVAVLGGFTPTNAYPVVIYLKNEPVGATWTQSITGTTSFQGQNIPDTTYYTFTIQSVGGTRTVNNVNYTNVVTVQVSILDAASQDLLAEFGGLQGVSLAIPGTYYFSENVGLIEADITSATWGLTLTQQLQSYTQ